MNPITQTCIFGPVPSRRYGRSLGIDLVRSKTCNLNCLFCQLGSTPQTTSLRKDYIPIVQVLNELKQWLALGHPVDILTLCGGGEPTLHKHFGDVLRFIREETPYPSLLMSNGILFTDPEVRRDAALATRVKVSLHAWDQASFEAICRPDPGTSFSEVVEGYKTFRAMYTGKLDIEVFIIPGMNDAPEQLNRILPIVAAIAPDTVTVNTAERPPAESCVKAVPPAELAHLRQLFATVSQAKTADGYRTAEPYSRDALEKLARRHPLTVEQFARYFNTDPQIIHDDLKLIAQTDAFAARSLESDEI